MRRGEGMGVKEGAEIRKMGERYNEREKGRRKKKK